ncbi:hypothetical protein HMPREF1991_00962 [Hoylesella loescheii DSM 19665 = JCM 12249 = ATCC 15930]|uniref:Uncharacterized protein n=1 Tax=Hoylesella loescheii DSM 19665 = JCM 12249 = ATCC 15930 TaxID=1122985 RepID=A0A069QJZ5_HOYLO|nr:hypothetical protein HMPREF6745_1928 [Prevotella sp. oral taxon 472 str. F0295]KDR53007.1 hypothetical protein HMPREF1991_00962 [Hoylesella loescheii DSM 19665 = JCM 12249 = ATCC 15930]
MCIETNAGMAKVRFAPDVTGLFKIMNWLQKYKEKFTNVSFFVFLH